MDTRDDPLEIPRTPACDKTPDARIAVGRQHASYNVNGPKNNVGHIDDDDIEHFAGDDEKLIGRPFLS